MGSRAFLLVLTLFAGTVAAAAGWLASTRIDTVRLVFGRITVDGRLVAPSATLPPGVTVETPPGRPARLRLARTEVHVAGDTRLRVDADPDGLPRLVLERGNVDVTAIEPHAVVAAGGTDIDAAGAEFSVRRLPDGRAVVSAVRGRVVLRGGSRSLEVPAGLSSVVYPGIGPAAPCAPDATEAFREALEAVETLPTTAIRRLIGVEVLASEARPADALTLASLLHRVEPSERRRLVERLVELAPPPTGVAATAVADGDNTLAEAWRRHLFETR
ncbi:MAG: hypothetical protein KJ066_19770 [Acidobacteria bacterium]|nr:hypothetical protein [Acidobacteriota bacterium]